MKYSRDSELLLHRFVDSNWVGDAYTKIKSTSSLVFQFEINKYYLLGQQEAGSSCSLFIRSRGVYSSFIYLL